MILKRKKIRLIPERTAYDVSRSWFTCTSNSQKERNARPRLVEIAKYRRKNTDLRPTRQRFLDANFFHPSLIPNCSINTDQCFFLTLDTRIRGHFAWYNFRKIKFKIESEREFKYLNESTVVNGTKFYEDIYKWKEKCDERTQKR